MTEGMDHYVLPTVKHESTRTKICDTQLENRENVSYDYFTSQFLCNICGLA